MVPAQVVPAAIPVSPDAGAQPLYLINELVAVEPAEVFVHAEAPLDRRVLLSDLHIFEVARLVVDAGLGRSDPTRELAGPRFRLHQAFDVSAIGVRREEVVLLLFPIGVGKY